jgi:hypothetical protein
MVYQLEGLYDAWEMLCSSSETSSLEIIRQPVPSSVLEAREASPKNLLKVVTVTPY